MSDDREPSDSEEWRRALQAEAQRTHKNWWIAFLLSLFFGLFGVDRFYLGYVGIAILKLVTLGGIGIWWLLDLILLMSGNLKDAEGVYVTRPF